MSDDDKDFSDDEEEEWFEEEEVEEIEEEHVEEESILTEYDETEFVSGAVTSLDSTLPIDLFEFEHSFGYDCQKYFNICACDESVVAWAAGSTIVFMDVNTKQSWSRRSTTGGTVGCVASYRTDPNYRIAIAEGREGYRDPLILMYTWPQMQIDAVLRDGTANAYSILDFSPDGEMLASVGKEPDYNLTIWNWKRHRILLRTSAFTYDVNAVMFSPYCPGQLTTAGAAHIKFWKMAHTFTGLKLKGELGRFGKTEICDVLGVYPMPDEKVLSGCEWGNVLVWEAGLVKVEVTQRGRKTCHGAPVVQFMLSQAGDEVTTIARDGCIRAWYWDTVEQSDPPEDDPYVELNPVAETCVPGCQIMCLRHQQDMFWYAQDGNGGIWTVELELDKIECTHTKVMTSHSGPVVGMAALRTERVLMTAGADGALQAYCTDTQQLLVRYRFPVAITCILYPPIEVDITSCTLLVGFADGVMRTLFLHPDKMIEQSTLLEVRVDSAMTVHSASSEHADVIEMISFLKPHSKGITQITINEQRTLLVTAGEDSTIFIYHIELCTPFELHRLGFIETPNVIAYLTWKPEEEFVLLMCGQVGFMMEAVLPDAPVRKYTDITTFRLQFESYKEILIKKQFMRRRPFPTEEDLASLDEEALKAKEEAEKEKDDEDEEEWLGEIQLMESESMLGTTVTWAQYCEEGIWAVQRGTGALLLVKPGVNKVLKYGPVPGAWCDDITALQFVCEGAYIVLGTGTGIIRVLRMPTEEEDSPDTHYNIWMSAQQKLLKKLKGRRLAKVETQPTPRIDFDDNYYLPMHDRYTGAIRCLEFSSCGDYLYTCGDDGNIFSYKINFSEPLMPRPPPPPATHLPAVQRVPEPSTIDGEVMSHEQLKQKQEYDKMMAIANAHKKRVRDQLAELAIEYNKLIRANRMLPCSQQLDMTLDARPLVQQEVELDEARALTRRKLAHQLEASDLALHKMHSRNIVQLDVFPFKLRAIKDPEVVLRPLRQKNLSQDFYDQLDEVYKKMAEAALRSRRAESYSRRTAPRKTSWGPPRVASFLLGLPPRPPHPLTKALRNYYKRINRHHQQFIEWQEHLSRKPDPNALPPGAAEAFKDAESSIGNHLLKTQPDYVAPPGHNTQLRICLARQEVYDNKHKFNAKVVDLRQQKVCLVERIRKIGERLAEIRIEIPQKMVKQAPPIPQIEDDLEFPEKNLKVTPEPVTVALKGAAASSKREALQRRSTFPQPRVKQQRVPRFVPLMESRPLSATWEILRPRPDYIATPTEIEIRDRRIQRHLYEQDMLIADAEVAVEEFDSRLKKLQRERIRVQENNLLLELHLYQLHREMNVLNRFEAHEDRLAERVYSKLMQVRGVQDQIHDCERRIDEHISEKVGLDVTCQDLQRQFKRLVQDNKFADFLRRIFKKKYRPPRDKDEDDSSEEESSSSSSEEEDEGSIDSRDIGPIRLDPNICPEGCDKEIYDKTYDLRNIRHKHEQEMLEKDKMVELLKKDIEAHNRVKRKLSLQLEQRQRDLREFMMEKQSCMNDVEQVVVLRYDQIRASALASCAGGRGLSDTVVFPAALLSRLRARVLELQDEIRQQKQRHKINRTHLHRMNIDLRAMEAQASSLRARMRTVLTHKLGKPRRVDRTLDDLLKLMARKHKFSAALGEVPAMFAQLRFWRKKHSDLERKYLSALQNHSDRLRLAAALQADVLPQKPMKTPDHVVGPYSAAQYRRDVVRLRIVRAQQLQQIQDLEAEITKLKLKPMAELVAPSAVTEAISVKSELELFQIPRRSPRTKHKYFPITPLGSQMHLVYDVNVMKLIYDCLDSMRITRDDAPQLLTELTEQLPDIISGEKSRYEVVDSIVRTWLLRHGGDPRTYKRHTRAFDSLAFITDKLLRDHVDIVEGESYEHHRIMEALEGALKNVVGENVSLKDRLAPVLAALLHTAPMENIVTEDTMASIVSAVTEEGTPVTKDMVDSIDIPEVIHQLNECDVDMPNEELEFLIQSVLNSLRAQIITPQEAKAIDAEATQAMEAGHVQAAVSAVNLSTPAKEDDETDVTEDETDMKQLTETAGDPETVIKVAVEEKAPEDSKTEVVVVKTTSLEKPEIEITIEKEIKETEGKAEEDKIKTEEKPEHQSPKEEESTETGEKLEEEIPKVDEKTETEGKLDEEIPKAEEKTEIEEKPEEEIPKEEEKTESEDKPEES